MPMKGEHIGEKNHIVSVSSKLMGSSERRNGWEYEQLGLHALLVNHTN